MPLITAPYLARKLGATQLGVFSFTSSIVAYFTLFAMLGTINYGTRCIASVKDNRIRRNKTFTSIFTFQTFSTALCIIAYSIYLVFFCANNKLIATLQGIALLSCLVDINWLFFGVEDFQITVTRNIVIKLFTVVLILCFVNKEQDLWIYTLIMLCSTFCSNLILFAYLHRYATFTKIRIADVKEHIKPNLILFVPILAMSVYHTMDKTMLGVLSVYEQSGFYYNSDKLVQIPLLIITGVGTVMLPRMSSLLAEDKQDEANSLFVKTLDGVSALSIAIACGIAAIAFEFIPFFFGAGYETCIAVTIIFTPIVLIKGLSVIIRTQFLIPMGMEKEFTKSVIGGAIVNLFLNLLLIPKYGAIGAAIATVIAELVSCMLQFLSLRGRNLELRNVLFHTSIYIIIGMLMVLIVRLTAIIPIGLIPKLVMEIVVGASFYIIICLVFWAKTNNPFYGIVCQSIIKKNKRV
jgi:O-antigen/teichoic acid export membrane protein